MKLINVHFSWTRWCNLFLNAGRLTICRANVLENISFSFSFFFLKETRSLISHLDISLIWSSFGCLEEVVKKLLESDVKSSRVASATLLSNKKIHIVRWKSSPFSNVLGFFNGVSNSILFKFHFVDYHSFKNNATARLVCSFHDRSEQASFLNEYRGTSRVDISIDIGASISPSSQHGSRWAVNLIVYNTRDIPAR